MGEHIIPFKGRNHSGSTAQNLLWRDGKVYLMDNHRAALWCWQQSLDLKVEKHQILHIDRHTDVLSANLQKHLQQMPPLHALSIADYLNAQVNIGMDGIHLFRWDNYLSIHIAENSSRLTKLISADHGDGDKPQFHPTFRPRPDDLSENIGFWLDEGEEPWIVNVDLDYFFCLAPDPDKTGNEFWLPLFSDQYIECIFRKLSDFIKNDRIKVITISLTPSDFTPGWEQCLNLSQKIFEILGVKHPSDV